LIRLRELHNYLSEKKETNTIRKKKNTTVLNYEECQNEMIKFPQESLHSFRFSSACISTTDIRDELLKKKKRIHGTLPGHHLIKPVNRIKTNTVGSPVSISNTIITRKRRESLPPLSESPPPPPHTNSSSYSSSSSSSSSNSSIYTPPVHTHDDDEEEEDCYVPHLHNRLKQQNQAILTTYNDWHIILTNSIAQDVLVSHLHHKMNEEQDMLLVGKSVMDLIEPTYQNRLKTLIVKRRNELLIDHESQNNNGGMVLVCGNVVRYFIA
jgi:hypothetical protein